MHTNPGAPVDEANIFAGSASQANEPLATPTGKIEPDDFVAGPAHGERTSFRRQLAVLSRKNLKLKRSQTCCCLTCPFVPVLMELLLPVALTVLFGWVSTLIDTSAVASGWSTTGAFSGTETKQPLNTYYHAPASVLTAARKAGPGQGMWAQVAPLPAYLYAVMQNSPVLGPDTTPKPATVCSKIALVAGRGMPMDRVVAFQRDVHSRFHPEVVGATGTGYLPGFANATTVFESISVFEGYVESERYLSDRLSRDDRACGACMTYSDNCTPNVVSALVLEAVANSGSNRWAYTIRVNTTFDPPGGNPSTPSNLLSGLSTLTTKGAPAVDTLQRFLVPTTGAAYASMGFGSLQQLMDRYILNETTTPAPLTYAQEYELVQARYGSGFVTPWNDTAPVARNNATAINLVQVLKECAQQPPTVACKDTIRALSLAEHYVPESVNVIPFPINAFTFNTFYDTVAPVFPLFFLIMAILTTFLVHSALLLEKETRMREMLRIMGVTNEALMASWYAMFGFIYFIFAIIIALSMKYGVVGGLLPHSDFAIILLFFYGFFLSIVSWAYCIVPFFSKARIGSIGGTLLFFLAFFASSAVRPDTTLATRRSMCLLPPVGLAFGVLQFSLYESSGVGVQWSNIDSIQGNFSFQTAMGMLYLDVFLYAFLGWYFDKVVPQEFGTRLPPWFLFMPSYWSSADSAAGDDSDAAGLLDSDSLHVWNAYLPPDRFEPVSAELCAQEAGSKAVNIRELTKEFETPDGIVAAVNKLSLSMYEGQIFCLLGHNGAGKTTTISMLTGMITPSSGDATVAGDSIVTNMSAVRQHLSVCPQHDVLYPNLTVSDHLEVFGRLKGLEGSQLDKAITTAIARVGLTEKRYVKTAALSGGMKRKLSVAMALLTDTKFTFLDEPTSGMDPYSRRSTWDTLRNARDGRVLLLTTHFMDEADLLGDRIGIMSKGQLQCCGSSLFLKNRFGAGYRLVVVKRDDNKEADVEAIRKLVTRSIVAAKMSTNVGTEVSFELPIASCTQFPQLLGALEAGKRDGSLCILEYGISVTTMEEVFIKVARGEVDSQTQASAMDEVRRTMSLRRSTLRSASSASSPDQMYPLPVLSNDTNDALDNAPASEDGVEMRARMRPAPSLATDENSSIGAQRKGSFLDDGASLSGIAPAGAPVDSTPSSIAPIGTTTLWRRQFWGLLRKRFQYAKRDKKAICCNTVCPAIYICVSLAILVSSTVGKSAPPFVLSMTDYNENGSTPVPVFGAGARNLVSGLSEAQPIATGALLQADEVHTGSADIIFPPISTEPDIPNGQYLRYVNGFGAGAVDKNNNSISAASTGICSNAADLAMAKLSFCTGALQFRPFSSNSSFEAAVNEPTPCGQAVYNDRMRLCGIDTAANAIINTTCNYFTSRSGQLVWGDITSSCKPGRLGSPLGPHPSQLLGALTKLWSDGYATGSANGKTYRRQQSTYGAIVLPEAGALPNGLPRDYYVLQNTSSRHAPAIFTNLLSSALLGTKTPQNKGTIKVTNHPLPLSALQKQRASRSISFSACLIIMIAFSFIPAGIAAFVVREREAAHNSKHQQLLSGASIPMYWLSNYAFDLTNYMLPFAAALILIKAFNFSQLVDDGALGAVALLLLMFGLAMIPWTYALSFLFRSHTSAQIFAVVVAVMTGVVLMIAAFVMSLIDSTRDINNQLLFLYYWFPPFALGWGLYEIVIGRFITLQLLYAQSPPPACAGEPLLPSGQSPCLPGLYAPSVTGHALIFMAVSSVLYFALTLAIDFANSTPWLRGLLQMDVAPPNHVMQYEQDDDVQAEERRVAEDAARGSTNDIVQIRKLLKVYAPAGGFNPCSSAGRASRQARAKVAVKNLSYGVLPGECFGFLGINGAGKTTTMKMLTGDYLPSSGTAVIDGHDILSDQLQVRAKLGYCPQFDALLDKLTVREHIELFARIKGVPPERLEQLVTASISELDLIPFENKLAGRLSGGNKRKLSVAVAMIGAPPVVFLDEPSTGMDPVARRFMWDVIARISTRSQSSAVILTTHLMEECEALCSRVGIMVGGRLRCLGSVQHIKSKFGAGLMAEIVVHTLDESSAQELAIKKGLSSSATILRADLAEACRALGNEARAADINQANEHAWALERELTTRGALTCSALVAWFTCEQRVAGVVEFVSRQFGAGAQLVERQGAHLRFKLPGAGGGGGATEGTVKLESAFQLMESHKATLHVREYSLSQTTLEQIFNQFASEQEEETGGAHGIVLQCDKL